MGGDLGEEEIRGATKIVRGDGLTFVDEEHEQLATTHAFLEQREGLLGELNLVVRLARDELVSHAGGGVPSVEVDGEIALVEVEVFLDLVARSAKALEQHGTSLGFVHARSKRGVPHGVNRARTIRDGIRALSPNHLDRRRYFMIARSIKIAVLCAIPLAVVAMVTTPARADRDSSPRMAAANASETQLDEAAAKLDTAKQALKQKNWEQAITLAAGARKVSDDLKERNPDRLRTLTAEAITVEGLAYRGKGDPLGAALAMNDNFDPSRCTGPMTAQCADHYAFLYKNKTYKSLLTQTSSSYGYVTEADHVVSFYSTVLGNTSLTQTELGALPRYYSSEADYLAIWVTTSFATKLRTERRGDNREFVLKGSSYKDAIKTCDDKVGEVEIGGSKVDVMKCKELPVNYKAATLTFTMSSADAEKVTLDKQRALLVFRRQNFRSVGNGTWSLGQVRLARVGTN